VDREDLEAQLETRYDASPRVRAVVARQARDLAEGGQFQADFGAELDADTVLLELADAPAEYHLLDRWNWWIGSLELSHGGYERFAVRTDLAD
jgi:hypothetical protein